MTPIITFTVSTAIGAWIKLKNKQIEAQRHQTDLWARKAGVIIEDRQKALDEARQRGDGDSPGDASIKGVSTTGCPLGGGGNTSSPQAVRSPAA